MKVYVCYRALDEDFFGKPEAVFSNKEDAASWRSRSLNTAPFERRFMPVFMEMELVEKTE